MEPLINGPFPCCLLPLSQNKSLCKTIHYEMCFPYRFIFVQIKLIFVWKVLQEARFETEAQGNSVMASRTQPNSWSLIMFDWLGRAFKPVRKISFYHSQITFVPPCNLVYILSVLAWVKFQRIDSFFSETSDHERTGVRIVLQLHGIIPFFQALFY